MTTAARETENATSEKKPEEGACTAAQIDTDPAIETCLLSNFCSFSGATEESLSAFAKRTLQTLGVADACLDYQLVSRRGGQFCPGGLQ